jgi:hypothetical protein
MKHRIPRRDVLELLAIGGVFLAGGCAEGTAPPAAAPGTAGKPPPKPAVPEREEFYFVQLSDTHWGYRGDANPEANETLRKAIATINAVETKPEFVVFTGDLTHTTDDPKERRSRMTEFREIVAGLSVPTCYFIPGEHDASLDHGEAFHELFGDAHYAFDHEGFHFVALDNVSAPTSSVGAAQLEWLRGDLAQVSHDTPLVVLAHRPLFDLFPAWDWATRDGSSVLAALEPFSSVTVLYGHVHQEHHHATGHIQHHAGRSLVFPLPAPGSVPKKAPVPWDPEHPFAGLGSREVAMKPNAEPALTELPVTRA